MGEHRLFSVSTNLSPPAPRGWGKRDYINDYFLLTVNLIKPWVSHIKHFTFYQNLVIVAKVCLMLEKCLFLQCLFIHVCLMVEMSPLIRFLINSACIFIFHSLYPHPELLGLLLLVQRQKLEGPARIVPELERQHEQKHHYQHQHHCQRQHGMGGKTMHTLA